LDVTTLIVQIISELVLVQFASQSGFLLFHRITLDLTRAMSRKRAKELIYAEMLLAEDRDFESQLDKLVRILQMF
jgi:hypothetical protein